MPSVYRDRVLHEALTARPDPPHLALVFGLSRATASKYTLIACDLLADQRAAAAQEHRYVPGEPGGIPELSGVEAVTGAGLAAGHPLACPCPSCEMPVVASASWRIASAAARCSSVGCGQYLGQASEQGAVPCSREDTEEMNRGRAETCLRLLAEAELRRVTTPGAGVPGRRNSARLALVAQALAAVGAVDVGAADEIRADLELAVAVRQPGQENQASTGQRGLSPLRT